MIKRRHTTPHHTTPNHAMSALPCLALPRRGKASERARVGEGVGRGFDAQSQLTLWLVRLGSFSPRVRCACYGPRLRPGVILVGGQLGCAQTTSACLYWCRQRVFTSRSLSERVCVCVCVRACVSECLFSFDRKTSRTALLFLRSFLSTAFLALFLFSWFSLCVCARACVPSLCPPERRQASMKSQSTAGQTSPVQ